MTITEQMNQKHQENLQRLKGFRLLDDDFLTKCFDRDTTSIELVLQIILEKPDLKVLEDGTITLEKMAEFVGLSVDEVQKLKTDQNI